MKVSKMTVRVHGAGQSEKPCPPNGKDFLKNICPVGFEGRKFWYTIYDSEGREVEQGQNIGKYSA